jgi:hypothetical protein
MIKKSFKALNGIKATTQLYQNKHNPHKHHSTIDAQEKVQKCLNCTKPASECKGNCFEK